MSLEVKAGDAQVVQITVREGKACQNPVHHWLKAAPSIAKTKRHPPKLEEAKGGDNGRLLSVLRPHRDLSVAFVEVYFGEDCAAAEAVRKIQHG